MTDKKKGKRRSSCNAMEENTLKVFIQGGVVAYQANPP